MKFTILTEKEFKKYADKSPYKSFMQTPEIAALREKSGWLPYYYGVKDDHKILAATMLLGKPGFLNRKIFYAPGGPLLDLQNTKLTNFFLKNLTKELKNLHALSLKIIPNYELLERDRDGQPVPGGFDHQKAIKTLTALGFKPTKNTDQPRYLFVMDINGRTPDQLLADFKRNTRNHIKKAEKMGVRIRELSKEELPLLKSITESTSKRRDFTDKPLEYYERMYDLFATKDQAKFILAEAALGGGDLNNSQAAVTTRTSEPTPRRRASAKRCGERINSNPDEENSGSASVIPLSAAMFITYGDEIIYLFSGSDQKYMRDYNAQYEIQWHMIKYAAENGYKTYNFYGINGLPDPTSKDYGIYDFKKGFGGRVVELIGAFELPLHPTFHLYKLLSKIRHLK